MSDIALHLPLLTWLASVHDRVTEFGVRKGESTRALLAGNPRLVSYDIVDCYDPDIAAGTEWAFVRADTLTVDIAATDLLFIDTVHTYEQLSGELARHAGNVTATIALHDTYVKSQKSLRHENDAPGMQRAVAEFAAATDWTVVFDVPHCNGMTILRRL